MQYETIKSNPVAKFVYRGSHSKPVRRTILITENTKDIIKGYEVREGNEVRETDAAPIKSFRKDKIAGDGKVTRMSMKQMAEVGV